MPITAIYPGTFDPITSGHKDIVIRAGRLFERVIVAIAAGSSKQPLFSLQQRIDLARQSLAELQNVEVIGFHHLLADLAREQGATVLVRGVRSVADFDYERQLAQVNAHLRPGLETITLFASEQFGFISSTIVKDVAKHGGSLHTFVCPYVQRALQDKYRSQY